jgi:hypothetical protein
MSRKSTNVLMFSVDLGCIYLSERIKVVLGLKLADKQTNLPHSTPSLCGHKARITDRKFRGNTQSHTGDVFWKQQLMTWSAFSLMSSAVDSHAHFLNLTFVQQKPLYCDVLLIAVIVTETLHYC